MHAWHYKSQCEMDRHPNDERVALRETTNTTEGRFSYSEIHEYVATKSYPEGFTKEDKLALRKRSKYFAVREENLYYVGGKYTVIHAVRTVFASALTNMSSSAQVEEMRTDWWLRMLLSAVESSL